MVALGEFASIWSNIRRTLAEWSELEGCHPLVHSCGCPFGELYVCTLTVSSSWTVGAEAGQSSS
jgi:hypothetical protein